MGQSELVADCSRCAGLCCVALAFDASEDFAFDKPAGVRCPNPTREGRCGIHAELRERGFRGCAAFDCHGAGQVATAAFRNESDETIQAAFLQLKDVHRLMWLLREAAKRLPRGHDVLRIVIDLELETLETIASTRAEVLIATDLREPERRARALLRSVGHALRDSN